MSVRLIQGDCRRAMRLMARLGIQVDAIVTDPPYHLTSIVKRFGADGAAPAKDRDGLYQRASAGFMGKVWDGGDIAFDPATWALALAVLKPGGYLLAFASTRGFGRMSVAIEDAGFITHPLIAWIFGTGFPKATRIKAEGYDGFRYGGQVLKPAIEPIYMGQKPFEKGLSGTENILKHGTGAVNVGACKVPVTDADARDVGRAINRNTRVADDGYGMNRDGGERVESVVRADGRWPANVCHDGSEEVEAAFAAFGEAGGGFGKRGGGGSIYTEDASFRGDMREVGFGDSGTASRFFYSAKAGPDDRFGSKHPTVKPVALMRWLCRLVTPPGGLVLDPFAGSGTTGIACRAEGFNAVLIEAEPEYCADIRARLDHAKGKAGHSAGIRQRHTEKPAGAEGTPLFDEAAE